MKIAIIDNRDSFTYNIVDLVRKISNKNPQIINSSDFELNKLSYFEKLILSPGPGLPKNYPLMAKILNNYCDKIPILGICLGHQAIAEYYGAKLKNMNFVVHGQIKTAKIVFDSKILRDIPDEFQVGLYHSWVVEKNNFPKDLVVTSISEDGLIMSMEHKKYPVFGLQFHPESFLTVKGKKIIENFINL